MSSRSVNRVRIAQHRSQSPPSVCGPRGPDRVFAATRVGAKTRLGSKSGSARYVRRDFPQSCPSAGGRHVGSHAERPRCAARAAWSSHDCPTRGGGSSSTCTHCGSSTPACSCAVHKSVVRIALSSSHARDRRCCRSVPRAIRLATSRDRSGGKLLGCVECNDREPIHFAMPARCPPAIVRPTSCSARQPRSRPRTFAVGRDGINDCESRSSRIRPCGDSRCVRITPLIVEQLIRERHCTMAELAAVARRLCHPRRRGSASIRAEPHGAEAIAPPPNRIPRSFWRMGCAREAFPSSPSRDLGASERFEYPASTLLFRRFGGRSRSTSIRIISPPRNDRDKRRDRQCHLIGWQVERVTEIDLLDVNAVCSTNSSPFTRATRSRSVTSSECFRAPGWDGNTRSATAGPETLGQAVVGGGLVEEVAVPAGGGEGDRAGFVFEHPPGEVAAGPVAGRQEADRAAGTQLVAEDLAEQRRHLVIREQMVTHGRFGSERQRRRAPARRRR